MALGIGFGLDRVGLLAVRAPVVMTCLMLALMAVVAATLPRVTFDEDINRVFLSSSPLSESHRAMEADGPRVSTIALLVEAEDVLGISDLEQLRDLALDLELTPGVLSVASPFALRFSPVHAAYPDAPVFPAFLEAEEVTERFAAFQLSAPDLPKFVTPDFKTLLISAIIDLGQVDLRGTATSIKDLYAPLASDEVEIALTGEDVVGLEIVDGLKADLVFLNGIGVLIVALAALIILRHGRLTLLATLPGIAGALVTLALSVWLGFPVTVVSNVIPILVLVLGVADGVHLARYYKSVEGPGAVEATLRTIGPACALTAITTSIAFAGVLVSDNAQLREFAILGALGVILSFMVIIVCFALLAQVMRPAARDVPNVSAGIAERVAAYGATQPKLVIATALGLLAFGAWGYSATTPSFPLFQNLPVDSPTGPANDRIEMAFGGAFQAWIEVPQTGDAQQDWERLSKVAHAVQAAAPLGTTLSEVSFAAWQGTPDVALTPDQRALLPASLTGRLRSETGVARIGVSMPEPMRSARTLAQFDFVERTALTAGASAVLGLPAIMRHESVSLIRQQTIGLVLACLASTGIIALAFRDIRLVPLLLLPNLLPILLVATSLHLVIYGQISPVSILALTLAFGIAVDDTIHFLSRHKQALAAGMSNDQAIKSAIRTAGEVMVITTILLNLGLGITIFSGFQPIRLFGFLLVLSLWIALIVDLIVLPALLRLRGDR